MRIVLWLSHVTPCDYLGNSNVAHDNSHSQPSVSVVVTVCSIRLVSIRDHVLAASAASVMSLKQLGTGVVVPVAMPDATPSHL